MICQHLTSGELQNQFEIFISSRKTGSETSFQYQDLCNYRVKMWRGGLRYGAPVGPNAASILRRYEFFNYAGEYDMETHEALVGSDSHPLDSELGNYIGAQNAAANLNAVPLPPAFVLLASGLLGLLGVARRKTA